MDTNSVIQSLFKGRRAVLATMHQKEKVMAPILEENLGIQLVVPHNFNTDHFGTFTREVERMGDQLEAARNKARESLNLTGETLAFASEGSFGPHPNIPIAAVNIELVILLDTANDLEIVGESISFTTNFGHQKINTVEEALAFAEAAGFPEHGMVVRSSENNSNIVKGITSEKELEEAVRYMLNNCPTGGAYIETDMRAMYNPTRMEQIKAATNNLVQNIFQLCPTCSTPGFKLTERKKGLPCMDCGFPTDLIRSHVYICKKCGGEEEKMFPTGKKEADPSQCMYCNP